MEKGKKIIKYIDPPLGWACGFPKELPDGVTDIKKWLLENGYPISVMNALGDNFTFRIIETKNHKTK